MFPTSLQLKASDGELHTVDFDLVKEMGTIRKMLMMESSDTNEVVPLSNIDSGTLKLLITWCKSSSNATSLPERINILKQLICEAGGEDEVLFQLINAANYLQMENLMETGTQLLADIIKNCDSSDEIGIRFNIESD